MKKNIVVGISGGIAAYKILELIKKLKKSDFSIDVVLTKNATKLIDFGELKNLVGNKIHTDLFNKPIIIEEILKERKVDHIELADKADLILIAPATANIIAKIAHGIADDYLSTLISASRSKIVIAPSMNVHMWTNPANIENIEILRKRGIYIIDPSSGELACGYEGLGRLEDIEIIFKKVQRLTNKSKSLDGKRILITGGGTSESIDLVRTISNRSSGKMASSIADECILRSGLVTYIMAKNSKLPRYKMDIEEFVTSGDLFSKINKHIKTSDIIFQCAAVSDFMPDKVNKKKYDSTIPINLILSPNQKIINKIKKINPKIKLIGFKAVSNKSERIIIDSAKKKLRDSNADVIIANDVSRNDRGFESDFNEVYIVTEKKYEKIELNSKIIIAERILDYLTENKII